MPDISQQRPDQVAFPFQPAPNENPSERNERRKRLLENARENLLTPQEREAGVKIHLNENDEPVKVYPPETGDRGPY